MNNRIEPIKITHIINPSRFYCRYLSSAEDELVQITKIEAKIKEKAKSVNKRLKICAEDLKPGDVRKYSVRLDLKSSFYFQLVAYYSSLTKKWIRCEVSNSD
jgi:hypothetical protein